VGVGELGARLAAAAGKAGGPELRVAASSDEAAELLLRELRPHDAVLVKGSRAMRLEVVVNAILQRHPVT